MTYTCTRCQITKPVADFPIRNERRHGTRCKACLAALIQAKRATKAPRPKRATERDRTEKTCNRCGETKPAATGFYWNTRRWSAQCRACLIEIDALRRKGLWKPEPPRFPQPRPQRTARPSKPTMAERFWVKVDRRGDDECWPWLGTMQNTGYGVFSVQGRHSLASRIAYTLAVGPIPDGLHIDHLCRNTACVNPAHLEPVTQAVNNQRAGPYRRKSHCVRGHAFTLGNTGVTPKGQRYCRTCARLRAMQQRVSKH